MSLKPIKKSDANKPWATYNDRKRARRQERQYILVVSEDKKSSVYYFNALSDRLNAHSAKIGVIPKGGGRNTQSLVNYVKKHKRKWLEEIQRDVDIDDFNEIWILFDRDGFLKHKFDNAIRSAESKVNGFHVAWSNECFELWYLLHFKDVTTPIARKNIYSELTAFLELKHSYEKYKGDEGVDMHSKMANNRDIGKAIKRAKRLHNNAAQVVPHAANPCTLVYKLVEKLLLQIED